jgi:predicted nicotinamide N-methyase
MSIRTIACRSLASCFLTARFIDSTLPVINQDAIAAGTGSSLPAKAFALRGTQTALLYGMAPAIAVGGAELWRVRATLSRVFLRTRC